MTNKRGEPDVIWLQAHGDANPADYDKPVDVTSGDVTWCWEQIYKHDVKYIRADLVGLSALLAVPYKHISPEEYA